MEKCLIVKKKIKQSQLDFNIDVTCLVRRCFVGSAGAAYFISLFMVVQLAACMMVS